ncbi:energy-coupled thiamine transporter ThiT [Oscillospiraceae bacterium 50-16]|nr:proton-coupled thiamine transporter YuaJ [Lawsonibacter sp.]
MKLTADTATKPAAKQQVLLLCEGAMMTALALILSYFKIQFLQAGSINFCMVPIILFAVRWGLGPGLLVGAAFGTLKFFWAEGFAINIWSFLLDYSVAYMFVGMAGLLRGRRHGLPLGCLAGCFGRFLIHFISGLTIYRILIPTELFGVMFESPVLFSIGYNGSYMLPSTIGCFLVCLLLEKPLAKYLPVRNRT